MEGAPGSQWPIVSFAPLRKYCFDIPLCNAI
jgi:hypothetical protein